MGANWLMGIVHVAVVFLAGSVVACSSPAPDADGPVRSAADAGAEIHAASDSAVADQPSGTLVFQSDRDGRDAIYTLDVTSRRITRLSGDPSWTEGNPRWSPDGARIVFKSNRAHYEGPSPEGGTPDFDLYVMNGDGSGRRRVTTDPANEQDPAWAPDGKSIVFSSDRDGRGDLYRVWLEGGKVDRLTRHFVGRAIMPAVSPSAGRVAFAAQTLRLGQFWAFQVHLLDLASGQTEAVDSDAAACWPAWSSDGSMLAHVLLWDDRPSALALRDLGAGTSRTIVGDQKMWSYYPDFSPDSRYIAYATSPAHHDGEDWDLAVYSVATGKSVRLTEGRGNDRLPDWQP
jgi:Tol biopolymer transport system component